MELEQKTHPLVAAFILLESKAQGGHASANEQADIVEELTLELVPINTRLLELETKTVAPPALTDDKLVEGIDPCFHDTVRKYGRPMFSLVMNAGMAREALGQVVALAQKHGSRGGLKAAEVLMQSAGQTATDYAQSQGWTEGELQQCDRDLQMAWAGKVATPGSSIILPH